MPNWGVYFSLREKRRINRIERKFSKGSHCWKVVKVLRTGNKHAVFQTLIEAEKEGHCFVREDKDFILAVVNRRCK